MDADLVKLLIALALIGACAWLAVASAAPTRAERPARERKRARAAPPVVSGAAPPPAGVVAIAPPLATGGTRPRIFTGEPISPEPGRPAARRALKLVAGLTALAAAGAVGVLALVRAMVEVFQRIGG